MLHRSFTNQSGSGRINGLDGSYYAKLSKGVLGNGGTVSIDNV